MSSTGDVTPEQEAQWRANQTAPAQEPKLRYASEGEAYAAARAEALKDDHHAPGKWPDCPRCTQFMADDMASAATVEALRAEVAALKADLEMTSCTSCLDRTQAAEARLREVEREIAEAAQEINCSGSVAHRIRVLRRELGDRLDEMVVEVRELRARIAALEAGLHAIGEDCPMCAATAEALLREGAKP